MLVSQWPIAVGVNVGCDLLLWLLLLGTGVLIVLSARDNINSDYGNGRNIRHLYQGVVEVVGSLFIFVVMSVE